MTKFSKLALCALVIGASVFTSCSDDDETQAVPELSLIHI